MLVAVVMAIAHCGLSFLVMSEESDLPSPVAIEALAVSVTDKECGHISNP